MTDRFSEAGLPEAGFPGRLYGPRVGAGGRSARFEVFTDRITVRDETGENHTLTPGRARVERSGDGVSIEASDGTFALVTTDRAAIAELRESAPVDIREGVVASLGVARRAHRRDRRWLWVSLVAIVAIGWGGYIGLMAAARAAVSELPISIDRKIGDLAGDDIIPGAQPFDDAEVEAAITAMVERLEPHAAVDGFEYRVEVLASEQVNAFALPGGRVFVLTGLIEAAESPDQVAGVLAHEIAHVTLRHGVRNIAQSLGLIAAVELLIGDFGGLSVLGVEAVRLLAEQGYSRELETEADVEGVRMLREARIDPRGLARFFELLRAEVGGAHVPAWLGSHPELADRIASVERLAAQGGPIEVEPFDFDWEAIRERVRR